MVNDVAGGGITDSGVRRWCARVVIGGDIVDDRMTDSVKAIDGVPERL